jgi:hypothetical protein
MELELRVDLQARCSFSSDAAVDPCAADDAPSRQQLLGTQGILQLSLRQAKAIVRARLW